MLWKPNERTFPIQALCVTDVSGGALVPLLISALNYEEVKKIASHKDINVGGVREAASTVNDVKKEEPEDEADVDELMAVTGLVEE